MIYVRPFKKEDLKAIDPVEPLSFTDINDPEFAQAVEDSGLAVTGIKDGRILGCGGVHPINEWYGELWLRIDRCSLDSRITIFRLIKEGLKIVEECYEFDQLSAAVNPGFPKGARMMEKLGFEIAQEQGSWIVYTKRAKNGQPLLCL